MTKKLSRRSLLIGGAALAAGSCLDVEGQWKDEGLALCSSGEPKVTPGDPAQAGRVLEVNDPSLWDGDKGEVNAAAVAAAWQKLLLAVTGKADAKAAWDLLIPNRTPTQIVGLKVNTLSPHVPTSPALVTAVIGSLRAAGVAPEQILVWDRRLDELTRSQLTAEKLGVPVEGTWETPKEKGAGRGYEATSICLGGRKAKLSNILTRRVDHLINLAVMKRHAAAGFTGCLKNHYGSIDNPGDFHDKEATGERRFEKAIPALNVLPEIAGKTRLWVVEAVLGVVTGDTDAPSDCVPHRLLAGLDPLALDVRGRQIRDLLRVEEKKLEPDPETISEHWVQACARAGLGKTEVKLEPVS